MAVSKDSFKTRRSVDLDGVAYDIFSLPALAQASGFDLDALPYSRRVLLPYRKKSPSTPPAC